MYGKPSAVFPNLKYFSGKNEKVCDHVAVLATLEDSKHRKEPFCAE